MEDLFTAYGNSTDELKLPAPVPGSYVSKKRKRECFNTDSPPKKKNIEPSGVPKTKLEVPPQKIIDLNTKDRANRVPRGGARSVINGHTACVNRIRWSLPNAHLLASCSMDKTVRIWDVLNENIKELCCFQHHTEAVKDVQWKYDSSEIISCGFDKTVQRINVTTGQCLKSYNHTEYITSIQYYPRDNNLILAGGYRHGVVCWDTRSNSVVKTFVGHFGQVQSIAFTDNGNEVLTCSDITKRNSLDKAILVWDFKTCALLSNQVYQEAYTCTCLKTHPTTRHFLAQSNGGYIAIFSTTKPYKLNKTKRFEGHKVSGYNLGFDISPDGSLVCTGSADGRLFCYNWYSCNVARIIKAHHDVCMDVAFHPLLPTTIATSSWGGQIKIWE